MANDPKNPGKDRGALGTALERSTLRAPPTDQITTDAPDEKVIDGEFEEEEEAPPTTKPTPRPPDPHAADKATLIRRASATNMRAAEILETLKKSSRPPK